MSSSEEEEQDILKELVKLEKKDIKRNDMLVSGWDDADDLIEEDENPHETPEKEILWAASENKIEIVEQILKTNPECVNVKDRDGYTPLHKACYNDNLEMAELLLKYKANPNALTEYKWTPLHSACKWNSTKCVALLLQHEANVNANSDGHQTPLHIAGSVSNCRETLVTLLMDPNIKPSLLNNSGEKAEDLARRSGPCYPLFKMAHSSLDIVETGLL